MSPHVALALARMVQAPTRQAAAKQAGAAYHYGAWASDVADAWREWSRRQDELVQVIHTDPASMCRCAHALHDGRTCPRRACGCRESRPQMEATA